MPDPADCKSTVFCKDIQEPAWDGLSDFTVSPTVDVWRISIPQYLNLISNLYTVLSQEELLRIKKYYREKDKNRFAIGKGMLRIILSGYLKQAPDKIIFGRGTNRKPFVKEGPHLQVNVSYSRDWSLIVVASVPVGVDIEFINHGFDYENLLENCFMAPEILAIRQDPYPAQAFFKFWTRKEALLKATSLGLDDYLTDFSCLNGMQEMPRTLKLSGDWEVDSFLMEKDYQVSIAHQPLQTIRYCNNPPSLLS